MGRKAARQPPAGESQEETTSQSIAMRPRRNLKVPARLQDGTVKIWPEGGETADEKNNDIDPNLGIVTSDVDSRDDTDESTSGVDVISKSYKLDDGRRTMVSGRPAKQSRGEAKPAELEESDEVSKIGKTDRRDARDTLRTIRVRPMRRCKAQRKNVAAIDDLPPDEKLQKSSDNGPTAARSEPGVEEAGCVPKDTESSCSQTSVHAGRIPVLDQSLLNVVVLPELRAEVEARRVPEEKGDIDQTDEASEEGKSKTCKKCDKCFPSMAALASHKRGKKCRLTLGRKQRKDERRKCVFCRVTFPTKSERDQHHREQHMLKKHFPCHMCGRVFRESYQCKRHLLSHTGERPFSCGVCGKEFADSSYVRRHMLIHSGHKPFQCHQCGRTFREKTHLSRHAETHKKAQDVCGNCGKALRGEVDRCTCAERVRLAPASAPTSEKKFTCGQCGKGFTKQGNFQRHLVGHEQKSTEEEPPGFTCDVCDKSFKQERHLLRHKRIHTGDKPFQCSECGKQFRDASYIRRHMRIHAGHKPFQCDVCKRTFRENGHLARHKLTHTGEKRFSCSTCGKGYQDRNCLLRHESSCVGIVNATGKKLLELCDICGKEYNNKASLRRHQLAHTGKKNFPCTKCPAEFYDNTNLHRHLSIHETDPAGDNRCLECKKVLRTPRALRHHMTSHLRRAAETVVRFECTLCDAELPDHEALTAHAAMHQGKVIPIKIEIKDEDDDGGDGDDGRETTPPLSINLECKSCQKLFASPSILAKHEFTHAQSQSLLPDTPTSRAVTTASTSQQPSAETMPPALLNSSVTTLVNNKITHAQSLLSDVPASQQPSAETMPPALLNSSVTSLANNKITHAQSLLSDVPTSQQPSEETMPPALINSSVTTLANQEMTHAQSLPSNSQTSTAVTGASTSRQLPAETVPSMLPNSSLTATSDDFEGLFKLLQVIAQANQGQAVVRSSGNVIDVSVTACVPIGDSEGAAVDGGDEEQSSVIQFERVMPIMDAMSLASALSTETRAQYTTSGGIDAPSVVNLVDLVLTNSSESPQEANEAATEPSQEAAGAATPPPGEVQDSEPTVVDDQDVEPAIDPLIIDDPTVEDPEIAASAVPSDNEEFGEDFPCQYCDFVCRRDTALASHMASAHREIVFARKIPSKRDTARQGRGKQWQCPFCNEVFSVQKELDDHSCKGVKKKPFKCPQCPMRFPKEPNLKQHLKVHQDDPQYRCSFCDKVFHFKNSLTYHERIHTREKPFLCQACGKGFMDKSHLRRHEKIHEGVKPYACKICPKRFLERTQLVKHSRIHSGDKPYLCSECGRSFADISHLRRHSVLHGNVDDEKSHKCLTCGKGFRTQGGLQAHMQTHRRGRAFLCDFCGKEFAELAMLTRHRYCHDKTRPFTCHFCDKRFKVKCSLVKHFRVHTGEKAPTCDVCSKVFVDAGKRDRHMESDHSLSFCDICGEAFTESSLLEKHVREHGTAS